MRKRFIITLIISLLVSVIVFGQRSSTSEHLNKTETEKLALNSLQEGVFERAILLYRRLLTDNEQNPKLNFLLGYCYLNTEFGLDKAITHLNIAVENVPSNEEDAAPLEAYYYLAKAHFQNNLSQKALQIIDELLTKIPDNEVLFRQKTNQLKENCENASMFNQASIDVKIKNITELNSQYSDKNPLIFNKGNEIIFTSRRESLHSRKKTRVKDYDDNIYYSKLEEGTWTTPTILNRSINTTDNESACWISRDGTYLIIQRLHKKKSNILFSKKQADGTWTDPQSFPSPINSRKMETFGSLSSDGSYLFFTSNRKGGYGGNDIYMSEYLGDNKWGPAINLGPNVNTSMNEETPFLHENGVLFFCSEGHVSMGGFDIFTSIRNEKGEWQIAANMGAPVNSIDDDFFYLPMPDGQLAYSSSQRYGSKGQSDIFSYQLLDSTGFGYAMVSGKIDCDREVEMDKNIEIYVRELQGTFKSQRFKINKYGNFAFVLAADNEYLITYAFKKQVFYEAVLKVPKSYSFLANDQSIRMKPVRLNLYDDSQLIKTQTVGREDVYKSENRTTALIIEAKEKLDIQNSAVKKSLNADIAESSEFKENDLNQKNSGKKYSIKLMSSKSRIPLYIFNGIEGLKEYRDKNGDYTYYFGTFNYEWEAEIELRMIRENYPKATVFLNEYTQKLPN